MSNIKEFLTQAIIDDDAFSVKLDIQMDRADYTKVNDVLERFNGKWDKKANKHIFPINPRPLIDAYLKTGILPEKNPTAFFPTPKALSDVVIRLSELDDRASYSDEETQRKIKVLEPSGGVGGLADEIIKVAPHVDLDVVEILDINQAVLREKGYDPICMDFMKHNENYEIKYDYILMNPPFSLKGDAKAYITHVEHAYKMLDHFGTLVAIVPTGFVNNGTKKEKEFLELIAKNGQLYKNPKDSFKESGTLIDTYIIVLDKSTALWKEKEYEGHANQYTWNATLIFDNESEFVDAFYKKVISDSFLKNAHEIARDAICRLIEEKKKEDILIPTSYIESYVSCLVKRGFDIREDEGLDIEVKQKSVEISNDVASLNTNTVNNVLYEKEQLNSFSNGTLF